MKKKSFFSGYNARLALAVVTLSGALLTGCYKDSDLDANTPGGSVTIPAATYTLTGTVVNAEGALVTDATVTVTPNTKLEVSGASFTAAVVPGDVKITVTPKAGSAYKEVTKTVKVIAVSAGQAAVYTETIVLTKDAPDEKVDAKYDVDVLVFGASDLNTPLANTEYTLKVTNGAGAAVSPLTGLAAGVYNVVVTPKDATKYNAYTTALNLATIKVEDGAANIPMKVYSVLTEKAAQKEYRVLSAYVTLQDAEVKLTDIQILRGTDVLAKSTANYIVYLDEKVAGATYRLVVNYTDNGFAKKVTRKFTDSAIAFPIVLKANDTSAELDGEEDTIDLDAENQLYLPKDLSAELDGKDYTGVFNVSRLKYEEGAGTLRVFQGTPSGLEFNKPIEISFVDAWGGQLGDLALKYRDADGEWAVDTDGGSVIKKNGKYVMNVMHFSDFKAEFASLEQSTETKEVADSTVTIVEKKNDTEFTVNKEFKYSYNVGMEVSNIEEAVRKAGYTDVNANVYVTSYITNKLADAGIVNVGIKLIETTANIAVAPWTCLEKVIKKQTVLNSTITFNINGKTVVVEVVVPAKVEILTNTYTFGHGHGHSHGHGHGDDDLNAGGGIVEAE